jgi:hypothetical protein
MAYQEFPKLLKRPGGAVLVVNSQEAQAAAIEAGWYLSGTLPKAEPVVDGEAEPVAAADAPTEPEAPKAAKRGRKPKAAEAASESE